MKSGSVGINNRIAINALSTVQGGGLTYLGKLIKYVTEFPELEIYLFVDPRLPKGFNAKNVNRIDCSFASRSVFHRTVWEAVALPLALRKLEIDLVFCPGGIINFHQASKMSSVVTFQNMLVFDEKEIHNQYLGYDRRLRLILLRQRFVSSFRRSDLIIYLSKFAKEAVRPILDGKCVNSSVIPLGLDDMFRTYGRNDLQRLDSIPEGEYLLYVSPVFPYKSQLEVVQAYKALCSLRQTEEKILFVGHMYPPYVKVVREAIADYNLENKVFFIGQLPNTDIPALNHHAKAIIFASRCENCPCIVLESMGSGRPLFLSNRGPMPEIAGDAALYFDPEKPHELTEALARYLDDETMSLEIGKKGYLRSLQYQWSTTARKTFESLSSFLISP